jgi:hypothetical protein
MQEERAHHAAEDLLAHGVAVLPYLDEPSRQWWEGLLYDAMDDMPEFRVQGRATQRVLGGFGALGNPSSFHHPTVRAFRRKFKKLAVRDVMRAYVALRYPKGEGEDVRLEALFDRLCVRCDAFNEPVAEAWHRDIYDHKKFRLRPLPHTLPDGAQDLLIGGWSNLDTRPQYFVGLVGTHRDDGTGAGAGGFSKYDAAQIKQYGFNERLAAQGGRTIGHTLQCDRRGMIVVPPGCAVFFFQRLVHAVKSGKQPATPSLRVFHGFRLTREDVSLFDLEGVVANGAVPRIPSGQMAAMYSQNHYAAFGNPGNDSYRSWGRRTFVDACLFRRTTPAGLAYATPGSPGDANAAANLGRYMPSLTEMGLWSETYRYSDDERRALEPQPLFV